MSFRWPYLLLALPLVLAALYALFAGSNRAREKFLGQFAAARLLPLLLVSYSPALRKFKHILLAAGLALVVVAMARPQWGYDWQEQRARGVDVIFAIDTSKSMLSQDIQPSRLERAKLAIYDFLEKMGSNRVGLVAFAGDAFLQCPLTLDYDAFRQSLDAVDTQTIAEGGTNIAAGLREAASALEKSGNHKIIILITDGEDLEGGGIQEARDLHNDEGVTIYTVGVGTAQGELIPVRDARGRVDYLRDASGQLVKSKLDSTTLTQIAEVTGGFYQPLGATGEGLNRIYEQGIKNLTAENLASKLQRQPIERFQWPLALALLILAVESLVGTRRPSWRRTAFETTNLGEPLPPVLEKKTNGTSPSPKSPLPPVMAASFMLALGLICVPHLRAQSAPPPADSEKPAPPASTANLGSSSPRTAQNLFQQGDYKGAAAAYGRASNTPPPDWRFRYNQGAALYRDKDYEGAAQAFTQALSAPDLALQQRTYYNLGNAQFRLGQADLKQDPKKTVTTWETAVKNYESAVELDTHDNDARYNLELVKKELDELKKKLEEQDKQQQQKDQQNQQQKDQNDQQQQNQQDQQNQQNDQQQNQQDKQDQQNQQNQQQNQQNNQQQQNQQSKQDQQKQQDQQQNQQGQGQDQQNQQGQENQQQNQSSNGQQQQNGQNQPSNQQDQQKNGQNQQNQQGQGQDQPQNNPQSQFGENKNQNQQPQNSQNQQGQNQNQPQNQANANQPDNRQNQPGNRGQPQNQQQQSRGQDQRGNQGQRGQEQNANQQRGNQNQATPKSENGNKEPASAAAGQPNKSQPNGANGTAAGAANGGKEGQEGEGLVAVPGVMTREEARLILDALKTSERKLPATRYISTNQTTNEPDQPRKDW